MGSGEWISVKLDENLGNRGQRILVDHGHDVRTVWEQDLAASCDNTLIEVCRVEGRCLVTLDMDFSNPLRYPPRSLKPEIRNQKPETGNLKPEAGSRKPEVSKVGRLMPEVGCQTESRCQKARSRIFFLWTLNVGR